MNESLTSHPARRLPDSWVQRIFATMQGHYGTRFINMWKTGQILPDGSDAGIVNAMTQWGEKLGGYSNSPETIKRALENLPNDPPSLPMFLQICRHSYVAPDVRKLEHKIVPDKERVAHILEEARQILAAKHVA